MRRTSWGLLLQSLLHSSIHSFMFTSGSMDHHHCHVITSCTMTSLKVASFFTRKSEGFLRHKGCPNREAKNPKCANFKGPHIASYKGCPEYKKQAFRQQHAVKNQKSYATAVGQNSLPQPKTPQTFSFAAEQLTKFLANVVIQITQPQVCYPNPNQDLLDLKSSICQKISNAAKTISSVDITGKDLFESSSSPSDPAPLTHSHS